MSDTEVLVKVEGLSKKFCKDMRTGLWYGVQDLFTNFIGNKKDRILRDKEFWALQDINFELRRGECLGLIGHNGAGKSTLLKILNGLIKPDAGKITIKGRVGALIELGAGFNPILTGRENIYNNGAVLGFTRKEIDEKLDEIIDFAEIREFVDMPVQHYSSGMRVRLGFAVAAQIEPDVLLIDEVLAVGDMGFVLKCFKTIDKMLPDTAIIFVSHNMPMISRICNKLILLDKGKMENFYSNVPKGIDKYYSSFVNNFSNVLMDDGIVTLISIRFDNEANNKIAQLDWGDDLQIHLKFRVIKKISSPHISIIIFDKEQRPVASLELNRKNDISVSSNGMLEFLVIHKNLQLSKGVYSINLIVYKDYYREPVLRINSVLHFQVRHRDDIWQPFLLSSTFKNKLIESNEG